MPGQPADARNTVVGLLVFQKRVLIVQTGHKSWTLPQGGINYNEPLGDALRRELNEELSLTPRNLEDIQVLGEMTNVLPGGRTVRHPETGKPVRKKRYIVAAVRANPDAIQPCVEEGVRKTIWAKNAGFVWNLSTHMSHDKFQLVLAAIGAARAKNYLSWDCQHVRDEEGQLIPIMA